MHLRRLNKWGFVGLITINATFLYAQDTHLLKVDDLFKLGIEHSLTLKADKINSAIAANEEAVAKTDKLPEISASLSDGYLGKVTVFEQGLTKPVYPYMPNWAQNYEVNVVQPIYEGGRIKHKIEKAALQRELIQATSQKDMAEVKLVLMEKYLELFRWYKQREVVTLNIEEAKQRLHDMQGMKKQGMITGNDLIRSELQLNDLTLMLREVEDNIRINSQQLDVALGMNEEWIIQPDEKLLEQTLPLAPVEVYIQQAYQQFPEMLIVNNEIKLAKKQEAITRADYLPSLYVEAGNSLGRPILNVAPVQDMFLNSWNIAFTLSYKLSNLYKNPKKVDITKQNISFQQVQKEQQEQNIRVNIKKAFIKHQETLDKVRVLTLSVKQANENYRIVYNKYKNNLAVMTDLLDASGVKLDAEMQLTTAKANVIYTYYQLLRLSGNI